MASSSRGWKMASRPAWPPNPDLEIIVDGTGEMFSSNIWKLRDLVSKHEYRMDIMDQHPKRAEFPSFSKGKNWKVFPYSYHPVLRPQMADQPPSWLHIKLSVKDEGKWVILVMRNDNLYVKGFITQGGVCYELNEQNRPARMLPLRYNSRPLGWDVTYRDILSCDNSKEVSGKLERARLGKTFAKDAVDALSRYEQEDKNVKKGNIQKKENDKDDPARLAVAGLIIMVPECARMNTILRAIKDGWEGGNGLFASLMDYVWAWKLLSWDLLEWREMGYPKYPDNNRREYYHDAVKHLHLGLNRTERYYQKIREAVSPRYRAYRPSGYSVDMGTVAALGQAAAHGKSLPSGPDDSQDRGPRRRSTGNVRYRVTPRPIESTYNRPRQRVQLLNVHSDFPVAGVYVSDGQRRQDIYDPEEQGQEVLGEHDLVLVGPGRAIAGYGSWSIEVVPADSGSVGDSSSRGDAGGPITGEWDCSDYELVEHCPIRGGAGGPITGEWDCSDYELVEHCPIRGGAGGPITGDWDCSDYELVEHCPIRGGAGDPITGEWDCSDYELVEHRPIGGSGPGRNVEVTYVVIPDAMEASVEVWLRLAGGIGTSRAVYGDITARCDDFGDWSVVLFRRARGRSRPAPSGESSLPLLQSVVALAILQPLRIEVDLKIATSDNQDDDKHLKGFLDFTREDVNRIHMDGPDEVHVNISWYPELIAS
ncbi:hypothetical protein ACP70R_023816 [Stipagrostis hirtigluma subsp. patula]